MSISQIYSNQYRWRRWPGVYADLGDISGRLVLDLGCGIGDQARDLSERGAHVLGIDANQDVVDHANRRGIPGARFLCDNITNLKEHELEFDGIWASFTVAYFPHFDQFLGCIALDGLARDLFADPLFGQIVQRDLAEGVHENVTGNLEYFTTAQFHRPEELEAEITAAGFSIVSVVGLEGPVGCLLTLARGGAIPVVARISCASPGRWRRSARSKPSALTS